MYQLLWTSIALLMLGSLLPSSAHAQARETTQPRQSRANTTPIIPVEIRVGLHRQSKPAMFFTISNRDRNRSIKTIRTMIFIRDSITLKTYAGFSVELEFAAPITPNESGMSLLTSNDVSHLDWSKLPYGRCVRYRHSNESRFTPGACTEDAYELTVLSIAYTDGSEWITPSSQKQRQASKEREEKESQLQSSQLSQVKVTKQEFADAWPFTVEEGILACAEGAVFFISNGKTYALNGLATGKKIDGKAVSSDASEIRANDADTGNKKSTSPLISRGLELCKK